ncbi:hypothetical protein ACFX2B_012930 [Malus domestica]
MLPPSWVIRRDPQRKLGKSLSSLLSLQWLRVGQMLHHDQVTLEVPKSDDDMVRVAISMEYKQFVLDPWTCREVMKATATPKQTCGKDDEHG